MGLGRLRQVAADGRLVSLGFTDAEFAPRVHDLAEGLYYDICDWSRGWRRIARRLL